MEFSADAVVIDKPRNDLDELVLEVTTILADFDVRYAVVSGYVAVLFGRARATEDIDVIIDRIDESTADELATALQDAGCTGEHCRRLTTAVRSPLRGRPTRSGIVAGVAAP